MKNSGRIAWYGLFMCTKKKKKTFNALVKIVIWFKLRTVKLYMVGWKELILNLVLVKIRWDGSIYFSDKFVRMELSSLWVAKEGKLWIKKQTNKIFYNDETHYLLPVISLEQQ